MIIVSVDRLIIVHGSTDCFMSWKKMHEFRKPFVVKLHSIANYISCFYISLHRIFVYLLIICLHCIVEMIFLDLYYSRNDSDYFEEIF